jgi:hypothetical protein
MAAKRPCQVVVVVEQCSYVQGCVAVGVLAVHLQQAHGSSIAGQMLLKDSVGALLL